MWFLVSVWKVSRREGELADVALQVRLLLLLLLDFQQRERESLSERAGGRVPSQVPPPTARCAVTPV